MSRIGVSPETGASMNRRKAIAALSVASATAAQAANSGIRDRFVVVIAWLSASHTADRSNRVFGLTCEWPNECARLSSVGISG
jgi:hypothetical protein